MIEFDSYYPPLPVWTVGKIYLIVEHFKHLRRFTPNAAMNFLCPMSLQQSVITDISPSDINISTHFVHTDWGLRMGGGLEQSHPAALY